MGVSRLRIREDDGTDIWLNPALVISAFRDGDWVRVKTTTGTYAVPWATALNQTFLTAIQTAAIDKINTTLVTVDFGAGPTNAASTTVTGLQWVLATSRIVVSPFGATGSWTAAQVASKGLSYCIGNIVEGVGFTLYAYCDAGTSGTYTFACMGD